MWNKVGYILGSHPGCPPSPPLESPQECQNYRNEASLRPGKESLVVCCFQSGDARRWWVRCPLLRLLGLQVPTSPLDPETIPCFGLGIAGPAVQADEGFAEAAFCGHSNNRCRGSVSLLLKIVSERKEVARANSRF